MFDNLGTAIVQALGFLCVFGFFVYQLLSEGKKPIQTKLNSSRKMVDESKSKDLKKTKKKGLFGMKAEVIDEEVKPKKKGLFGRNRER